MLPEFGLFNNFFDPFHLGSIGHDASRNEKKILIHLIGRFKVSDSFIEVEFIDFTTIDFVLHRDGMR